MSNISPSIIRINGNKINYTSQNKNPNTFVINPIGNDKKMVSVSIYSVSGALIAAEMLQTNPSIWKEMYPIFGVFQDIAMIVGALAILTGLIVMIFKKRIGFTIIYTASAVVLGCFLVPSAVMLVAILGKMLNGAFSHAFETFTMTQ